MGAPDRGRFKNRNRSIDFERTYVRGFILNARCVELIPFFSAAPRRWIDTNRPRRSVLPRILIGRVRLRTRNDRHYCCVAAEGLHVRDRPRRSGLQDHMFASFFNVHSENKRYFLLNRSIA
jgi:hypothetical protein